MSNKEIVVSTTRDVLWALGAFVVLLGLTTFFAGCCSYAHDAWELEPGFVSGAWAVATLLFAFLSLCGGIGTVGLPCAIISEGHFTRIDKLKRAKRDAESSLAQAEEKIAELQKSHEATRVAGSEVVELLGEIARRWEVFGKSND